MAQSVTSTLANASTAPGKPVAAKKIEIMWDATSWIPNGTWTDESAYVTGFRFNLPLVAKDSAQNPLALADLSGLLVSQGQVTFFNTLENVHGGTPVAGRYSQENQDSSLYTYLNGGNYLYKPIRIWTGYVTSAGTELVQSFNGVIATVTEDTLTRLVTITFTGREAIAKEAKFSTALLRGLRTDQVIATYLASVGLRDYPGTGSHPTALPVIHYDYRSQDAAAAYGVSATLERGLETLPYAGLDDESAFEESQQAAENACGRFFAGWDGLFYYHTYYWQYRDKATPVWTLSADTARNILPRHSPRMIWNSVIVGVNDMAPTNEQEIYHLPAAVWIDPGQTLTIYARFSNPVEKLIFPWQKRDYDATAITADDFTSGLLVTLVDQEMMRATFTVRNTSSLVGVNLNRFVIRGVPILASPSQQAVVQTSGYVGIPQGGRVKELRTNLYTQNLQLANTRGNILAPLYGNAHREYEAPPIWAVVQIERGDRVQWTVPQVGNATVQAYVMDITTAFDSVTAGLVQTWQCLDVTNVYPANNLFRAGVSTLGSGDVVGF